METTHTAFGWIHSYEDYLKMFKLSDEDLSKRIIVYPSDISNFNAKQHQHHRPTVSVDPKYQQSIEEIECYTSNRIHELEEKLKQFEDLSSKRSSIINKWKECANTFLADLPEGLTSGRYMSFNDDLFNESIRDPFDIALCPRCALEADNKDYKYGADLISKLCQIAKKVRIFVNISHHHSIEKTLGPLMVHLQQNNYGINFHEITINSPHKSAAMLEAWATECII
jgi:hypothetical protein